jgi:hypothetical protein
MTFVKGMLILRITRVGRVRQYMPFCIFPYESLRMRESIDGVVKIESWNQADALGWIVFTIFLAQQDMRKSVRWATPEHELGKYVKTAAANLGGGYYYTYAVSHLSKIKDVVAQLPNNACLGFTHCLRDETEGPLYTLSTARDANAVTRTSSCFGVRPNLRMPFLLDIDRSAEFHFTNATEGIDLLRDKLPFTRNIDIQVMPSSTSGLNGEYKAFHGYAELPRGFDLDRIREIAKTQSFESEHGGGYVAFSSRGSPRYLGILDFMVLFPSRIVYCRPADIDDGMSFQYPDDAFEFFPALDPTAPIVPDGHEWVSSEIRAERRRAELWEAQKSAAAETFHLWACARAEARSGHPQGSDEYRKALAQLSAQYAKLRADKVFLQLKTDTVQMSDGTVHMWETVIANASVFNGRNCNDPIDNDREDGRIDHATLFVRNGIITIKSHASSILYTIRLVAEIEDGASKLIKVNDYLQQEHKSLWLIKDWLPMTGFAIIAGQPSAGKSHIALELCYCLSAQVPFLGMRVRKQVPVAYVALEGIGGLPGRLRGIAAKYSLEHYPDTFYLRTATLTLTSDSEVDALAEDLIANGVQEGVVIIDTMAQAAGNVDENSSEGMGKLIKAAQYVQEKTKGLVVFVAHLGKDISRGVRGHGSLMGALDAQWDVMRDIKVMGSATKPPVYEKTRTLVNYKVKEALDSQQIKFTLEQHVFGVDEYGDQDIGVSIKHVQSSEVEWTDVENVKEDLNEIACENELKELCKLLLSSKEPIPWSSIKHELSNSAMFMSEIPVEKLRHKLCKKLLKKWMDDKFISYDELDRVTLL